MNDVENFVVAIARLCRQSIDQGEQAIPVDVLLALFEEHFDMGDILS